MLGSPFAKCERTASIENRRPMAKHRPGAEKVQGHVAAVFKEDHAIVQTDERHKKLST